jgi:hypothetical protein
VHATAERRGAIETTRKPGRARTARLHLGLEIALVLHASERDVDRPAFEMASRVSDQFEAELRLSRNEQVQNQEFLG